MTCINKKSLTILKKSPVSQESEYSLGAEVQRCAYISLILRHWLLRVLKLTPVQRHCMEVCGQSPAFSRAVILSLASAWLSDPVHVVVTPTITLFSLLLHNCNFITVMNHNVKICVF